MSILLPHKFYVEWMKGYSDQTRDLERTSALPDFFLIIDDIALNWCIQFKICASSSYSSN